MAKSVVNYVTALIYHAHPHDKEILFMEHLGVAFNGGTNLFLELCWKIFFFASYFC